MRILTLDPKRSHEHNPDCPMRLIPAPDGKNLVCLDCNIHVIKTAVEVSVLPKRAEREKEAGWWEDKKGDWHPPEDITGNE